MNRVSLIACAAALLLACPRITHAQEKTMTTSTGLELVWIPPGEFMMGSTPEERDWAASKGCAHGCCDREGNPRLTKISAGFWLGRTELTVEQWRKFVHASHFTTDAERGQKGNWQEPNVDFKVEDNFPVCWISWNDAVAYCQWLTKTEKAANKIPNGFEYRLPTESEWEYACRAGTKETRFWWGNDEKDGEGRLNWYGKTDGFEFLSPADCFKSRGRNRFGLADMLGNVWEWCLDDFDPERGHEECFKGNPNARVRKGGSCGQYIGFERCAARMSSWPAFSQYHFGFRVCCGTKPKIEKGSAGVTLTRGGDAPKPNVSAKKTQQEESRPRPVAGAVDEEMQKDARKFARSQTSIKGLYVRHLGNGLSIGGAQDIIATAQRVSGKLETVCDFTGEVANDTRISMEEAERLLKVRYPVWQAGHKVLFSYGDKYAKQSGGSAGGAFSVLLLSLLDGVQIDPAFAMTGDVTVDGKIREIGAAAEKIRGAMLEKCSVVAIPVANKENLNDLVVLYSPAMLWNIQIFSVATLDDAVAVARVDRAPNLAKVMEMFAQVQRSLGPSTTATALRSQGVYRTIWEVQRLAPNHLSAEFMLRAANNQLPTTLSLGGSLEEIWSAAGPLLGFLFADYKEPEKSKRYYMDRVPKETTKMALERLEWLQMRLHPKARDLKAAMVDYMVSLDQLHRMPTFASGTLRQHLEKRDKVLGEAGKLGVDRKALEEMMH